MSGGKRGRGLTSQEERLWSKVADSTKPMAKAKPVLGQTDTRLSKPEATSRKQERNPIPNFRVGERAGAVQASPTALGPAPVRMDKKAFGRLKRGRLAPEARIDLHGMTRAAAHPALTGFILRAHSEGKRLVLVITGKGRTKGNDAGPIPEQPGVLRRQVPHWLETPPLNQMVLQISPAHHKHGGSGAFYVYLRRR